MDSIDVNFYKIYLDKKKLCFFYDLVGRESALRSAETLCGENESRHRRSALMEDPPTEHSKDMTSARRPSPQPMETENRATDSPAEEAVSRKNSPIPGKLVESKGHPERKRRASTESGDSAMTKTSEGKEDDDDDENDDDEKLPVGQDIDPERLKAFNMFVRLFVDENLDRMVPISKQPKDKIQAILEACDRQFPEFHERSRKRIRTYLKSCRRMRRSKEHNGWEPLRPTPPHLTSAAAEGLLATACENESQNAKRMRMGLEPLPLLIIEDWPHSYTSRDDDRELLPYKLTSRSFNVQLSRGWTECGQEWTVTDNQHLFRFIMLIDGMVVVRSIVLLTPFAPPTFSPQPLSPYPN
ncbi:nucleolar protein 4 [Plakobranchus ocellatus]|uniref:Nucleolar protein 4 n=1 Tax=Plakobranchus ocellatus TaxID=259542 RepID=A0AAV4DVI7_9GAST|nr:nucleolar protein 4 [Plakobranchus ocellatus]